MTYFQLSQKYLEAAWQKPPNTANPCGPCPQIVQPTCGCCMPQLCPVDCCPPPCPPTFYVGVEMDCVEEVPCKCSCKKKKKPCGITIDTCVYGGACQKPCKKKKKPCSCKKPAPCCPPPCPPQPCCPQFNPCCPPNPCCDPNGADCNPIKGWPWITQTWGGVQRGNVG